LVTQRANFNAASIASAPEFEKKTMSSHGIRFTSASARRPERSGISSWIRLGSDSPRTSASARRTTGWLWPMLETQKLEMQSK
jgi:hypothetical protein